ncbi:MAG: hypothetical protein F6K35_03485 [Okeania sp. SIO2H7]|nr:hypothetical protein [Okeania sp. SIO2H7]
MAICWRKAPLYMSRSETPLQGFGCNDVVHQSEKRYKVTNDSLINLAKNESTIITTWSYQ